MNRITELVERPAVRLFLLAALTLHLELSLIRWMAANVIHLGFFANFVLMACFLGIGLGFLFARRDVDLFQHSPKVLFGLAAFTLLSRTKITIPNRGDVIFWGDDGSFSSPVPVPVVLAVIFVGIVTTFVGISQETGRSFAKFEPLKAYTIDILGSLTGIVVFTGLAFVRAPSWVWFSIAAIVWGVLLWSHATTAVQRRVAVVALVGLTLLTSNFDLWWHALEMKTSPYQVVTLHADPTYDDRFHIVANRIPSQTIIPAGTTSHEQHDIVYAAARESAGSVDNVMVIGAGNGVDVVQALQRGAKHVDAVEIDPAIAAFGRARNPDAPYDDSRVQLHVTDGRAFLNRTDRKYQLIVLALPDSNVLVSSQANVRQESFLFTMDAFRTVQERLAPGGVFVAYNFFRAETLIQRIEATMAAVWGHPPHVTRIEGSHFAIFMIGDDVQGPGTGTPDPELVRDLPTDDWPFIYLSKRMVPTLYWIPALLLILVTFVAIRLLVPPAGSGRAYRLPFFAMGGAFLLLETKSVIQFLHLFGNTWLVNSLVFFAVLVMVLLANLIVIRLEIRRVWPWYLLLAAALALGWAIPTHELQVIESDIARYAGASALVFSPIFLANVIFAGAFAETEQSDVTFGWNIVGTMVGGTLEYTALVLGYRNLAIVVAVLYFIAFAAFEIQRRRK